MVRGIAVIEALTPERGMEFVNDAWFYSSLDCIARIDAWIAALVSSLLSPL
jgi:hypothetical protein